MDVIKIELIALDENGATLLRHRVSTPIGDYVGTLSAIADLVLSAERELCQKGTLGIASPGAVSTRTGLLKNSNSTVLNGRPLVRDLSQRLGRPIRLENDANCFALSEAVDGAAAAAHVVFGVILGTGVGGGIVIGKELIAGHNSIAGEWGHTVLPWMRPEEFPGPECYCGLRGCIETFISGTGLEADYERATHIHLEGKEIIARCEAGEAAAVASLERYEDRLTRSLSQLVNILDPDVIVLGGGVSQVPRLYRNVPQRLKNYVFGREADTPVLVAKHGDASGVRGAAWLWPIETP